MYNEIEISPQPVTGLRRKVRRFQTITHEDGELSITLKVIFLAEDGTELIEKFRTMIGDGPDQITAEQFEALEKKFFPYQVTHSTRGSFIDPSTGDLVQPGTPGAVPEIEFLRSLEVITHLQPMLEDAGLIDPGEQRHIAIEEAYEKLVMLRMDQLRRY